MNVRQLKTNLTKNAEDNFTLNLSVHITFTSQHLKDTETSNGPLIKLNAHWALPVYPILKDQSQKHLTKKTEHKYNTNLLDCKNRSNMIASSED